MQVEPVAHSAESIVSRLLGQGGSLLCLIHLMAVLYSLLVCTGQRPEAKVYMSSWLLNRADSCARLVSSTGILLFAATSPVAALLTYCAMSALPFMSTASNIPLAILFSGGTVLYAATMHILPSALEGHLQHQHGPSVGGAVGSSKLGRSQQQQSSKKQLLLVSAGMLLPLVLSAISTHEH